MGDILFKFEGLPLPPNTNDLIAANRNSARGGAKKAIGLKEKIREAYDLQYPTRKTHDGRFFLLFTHHLFSRRSDADNIILTKYHQDMLTNGRRNDFPDRIPFLVDDRRKYAPQQPYQRTITEEFDITKPRWVVKGIEKKEAKSRIKGYTDMVVLAYPDEVTEETHHLWLAEVLLTLEQKEKEYDASRSAADLPRVPDRIDTQPKSDVRFSSSRPRRGKAVGRSRSVRSSAKAKAS